MNMTLEEVLAFPVADSTIRENLALAVEQGHLLKNEDGRWQELPGIQDISSWIHGGPPLTVDCKFHNFFLFRNGYAKKAVPFGCRHCYKIILTPKTLRQLVCVLQLASSLPYRFKCGISQFVEGTGSPYNAYFYANGLQEAKYMYTSIRQFVQEHVALGPELVMKIARGCSIFERHCGPADHYVFPPQLAEIESRLFPLFTPAKAYSSYSLLGQTMQTRTYWLQVAFSLGDETYRDFTQGQRLYPDRVNFAMRI